MDQATNKLFIDIIKQEVKPALGCTEPIAVALAVAKANENIGNKSTHIVVEVSANILKNGMGVGIPGTGMVGLDIAAALGITCGKSCYNLEVLHEVDDAGVEQAKALIADKAVEIRLADTEEKLYVKATCSNETDCSVVVINDRHDNISYEAINGIAKEIETDNGKKDTCHQEGIDIKAAGLSIEKILKFTREVDYQDIRFILEAAKVNRRLAAEGLYRNYGLQVGRTLKNKMNSDLIGESLLTHAMSLTAAASDARMSGCTLPAMSNSGSGNQGITVTMPVVATAERLHSSLEELARALVLSHLTAIHIKSHLGRLSALCGCVVASSASGCGICYLMGGDYEQICASLKNMIGNITGMVCDGAKLGCALKVATGVSCAVQSTMLAMDRICISSNDGIIEDSIEDTIENLCKIGTEGMCEADKVMLNIMTVQKQEHLDACDRKYHCIDC